MEELFLNRSPGSIVSSPCTQGVLVAIAGAPLDHTSTYRPGCRFGPARIREAYNNIEAYSLRRGIDVDEYCLEDLGDIAIVPGDLEESLRRIEVVSSSVFAREGVLGLLGGEHLVTLPAVKALSASSTPCLVVFDAHLDLREEYLGLRLSHASVMRRISELIGPERVMIIGVRAVSREELEYAGSRRIAFITSNQARILGVREVSRRIRRFLSECMSTYISVDMDVFDPAYAPGVGNPEAEGMEPWSVLDIVSVIIDERLRGFDIVEVSPPYDVGGITSILASKVLLEILASIHSIRGRKH